MDPRTAGLAPVRDLPGRVLRVDLLPLRLVRRRLGAHPAAVHGLGRAVAARHVGRARRDRRRHRLAVPAASASLRRSWRASRGSRSLHRRSSSLSRCSSSTPWARRAWHRSSTSSSDGDARGPRRRAPTAHSGGRTAAALRRIGDRRLALRPGDRALPQRAGLHKSATIQPEGWKRDVALGVTGPLESVSGALLLDRPRQALKSALGRWDDDEIDTAVAAPEPSPTTPVTTPDTPPSACSSRPSGSSASGSPATRSWSSPASRSCGRRGQPRDRRRSTRSTDASRAGSSARTSSTGSHTSAT